MSDIENFDWSKRYKDLVLQLENARRQLEQNRAVLEKTKMMVIETETANMELEQIFDQSSSGIWLIDTNFEILRVNNTLAALSGKNKDEVRGLKCYDVFPISLCESPKCPMKRIREEDAHLEYDIEKETGKGQEASYLLTVNPFFGLTGKIMGLVGEFKDITPRRHAEKALRQANTILQRLSEIDGLTQVANRRRFDKVLKHQWNRANRSLSPLSLIFCDIDYFKLFNDSHGHRAGDECLKTVARTIRSTLKRPEDFIARYGGEEFILVLPDTDGNGAFHLAEKMRRRLLAEKMPHKTSPAGPYVTMSFGITCAMPNGGTEKIRLDLSPKSLIEIADQALYEAKQNGRNRTVYKPPPTFEKQGPEGETLKQSRVGAVL